MLLSTQLVLADIKIDKPEWASFHRLVQELINGTVRRYTFTQWELELLLDLQNSRLRRSSRGDLLRKYARTVQQQYAEGAEEPVRLTTFIAGNGRQKAAAGGTK